MFELEDETEIIPPRTASRLWRLPSRILLLPVCVFLTFVAQASVAQPAPLKDDAPTSVSSSRSDNQSAGREARHYRELSLRLPSVAFTSIATDPGDPEIILVGSDGFIFKTDDGGDVWRPVLAFPRGLASGNMLLPLVDLNGDLLDDAINDELMGLGIVGGVLPEGDELADDGEGDDLPDGDDETDDFSDDETAAPDEIDQDVYTSTAGDSVLYPRQRAGVRALVYVGAQSATLYAATPRGLFRSVDGAESFQQMLLPFVDEDGGTEQEKAYDVRDVVVHPKNAARLWVGTGAGLLYSSNEGQSFDAVDGPIAGLAVLDMEISEKKGNVTILIATEEGAFRSTNGGKTFLKMLLQGASSFEPALSVAFDKRERTTYVGTSLGLFVAERGAAILERRENLGTAVVTALSIDPLRLGSLTLGLENRGCVLVEDRGFRLVKPQGTLGVHWVSGISRLPADTDSMVVSTEKGIFIYERGTGMLVLTYRMQRLRKRWQREPNLRETVAIAIAQAQLSPTVYRRMRMRAVMAPILPRITFRYKLLYHHDEDVGETLSNADVRYYTRGAVDPDLYTVRILPRDQTGVFHEAYILASWATDGLIYSLDEKKLTRILPRTSNERLKVVSKVVRTYHARRRLLTTVFSATLHPSVLGHQLLKLAELTAVLDAYTDGSFSRLAQERGAPVGELQNQVLNELALEQAITQELSRNVRMARTQK